MKTSKNNNQTSLVIGQKTTRYGWYDPDTMKKVTTILLGLIIAGYLIIFKTHEAGLQDEGLSKAHQIEQVIK